MWSKFTLITGLLIAVFSPVNSQDEVMNIVPNGSFEAYSGVPLGWFYSGKDFNRVLKYWHSPSTASPDVYGPKVFVPRQWREKGFGQMNAHTGLTMIGLTLYGCEEGKPHCREYVQIQLEEPLVIGQRYQIQVWVNALPQCKAIGEIGVRFSHEPVHLASDDLIPFDDQVISFEISDRSTGRWIPLVKEFVAHASHAYMIIGNFKEDAHTDHNVPENPILNFAYYYFDDIEIKKLPPILEVPETDDLSNVVLEKGKTIELRNIYFDLDKADFLPRSYRELKILLGLMNENPQMQIEILGHTDSQGTKEYNKRLSMKRAKAVVDYLITNGISSQRLQYDGFGYDKPLGDNRTSGGRQINRRVEFHILEY